MWILQSSIILYRKRSNINFLSKFNDDLKHEIRNISYIYMKKYAIYIYSKITKNNIKNVINKFGCVNWVYKLLNKICDSRSIGEFVLSFSVKYKQLHWYLSPNINLKISKQIFCRWLFWFIHLYLILLFGLDYYVTILYLHLTATLRI